MSPGESMSGHLTAAVKTYRENYTSHNPPALHNEKQTIKHDQKENLYGIRQNQYTSTEKAVTEPTDITKDLHVTSNETQNQTAVWIKILYWDWRKTHPRLWKLMYILKVRLLLPWSSLKMNQLKIALGLQLVNWHPHQVTWSLKMVFHLLNE